MAELVAGKLLFDQAKHKWKIEFFNENKQRQSTLFCVETEISTDVPLNEAEQFEVQFERKPPHGEPIKVRLTGKDFITRATRQPAPLAPIIRDQRNAQAPGGARDTRRERSEPRPERTHDNMPREFHNPYNFVPAVPRDKVDGATNDLGDKPPAGHDRFQAELLSGKLRVQMTVATPLLLPDTARVKVQNEHKTFPVREDANGKPVINPTAIKGMLRAAYEAVTNSRLSVFQSHDERLAFRMEAIEGAMMVPVRIEGEEGKEGIVFYTGTSEIYKDGRPFNEKREENQRGEPRNGLLCAAWLPMYATRVQGNRNKSWCISDDAIRPANDKTRLPQHGDEVFAWVQREQNHNFKCWRVLKLAADEASLGEAPAQYRKTAKRIRGYVCNTGQNIDRKHDEKIFFNDDENPLPIKSVKLSSAHREAWNSLIKDYRREHADKADGLEDPPSVKYSQQDSDKDAIKLEWSRHIQRTSAAETTEKVDLIKERLQDGALCYARVKQISNDVFEVQELIPVIISRRVHKHAPSKLLPPSLHPAYKTCNFSPADRVFGWVRQADKEKNETLTKEERKLGAYRGQVRLGAVELAKDNPTKNGIKKFDGNGLPLQILGQPKPQQGRFYVAETTNGEAQSDNLSNEDAGYKDGKGLRGRKVYPHHKFPKEIEKEYWDDPLVQRTHLLLDKYFQEFRRPDDKDQCDKQNRSIKGWVEPDTVFNFDIHFINLSAVELGALIWLLSLEDGFHRFGGGKPLGFGSVKLELEENKSEIFKGEELKKRYLALDEEGLENKPQPTAANVCLKAFEDAINSYPGGNGQRILQSFLAAVKGFDKPVHYPRKDKEPNADGKNFEWFVANNSRDGYKLTLPNLDKEIGLPLKPKSSAKK